MSQATKMVSPERRRSREIFERAEKVLGGRSEQPGAGISLGGRRAADHREGKRATSCTTPTGTMLLDYVCSWGAMLLGHAHPAVTAAIADQAAARNELWRDDRIGIGTRDADHESDSVSGESAVRFERDGSHDERGAPGTRRDQAGFAS